MRDMTNKQFYAALERHGMNPSGFMGYVRLNIPGQHVCVSMFNAGDNRRARLAYLLREQERHIAEAEKKGPA